MELKLEKSTQLEAQQKSNESAWHLDLDDLLESHECQATNDDPCTLLGLLNLAYDTKLKTIICCDHATFIPSRILVNHLDRKHQFRFSQRKTKILEKIRDHLCNDVLKGDACDTLQTLESNLPATLNAPLSVQNPKSIRFRYKCPECGRWIPRNEGQKGCPEAELRSHLDKVHSHKNNATPLQGAWCQHISIPHKGHLGSPKLHVFQLLNYSPPPSLLNRNLVPSFSTKTEEAPLHSTWFRELKWPEHRAFLQGVSHTTLKNLVSPPSKQLIQEKQLNSPDRYIEEGLLVVRKELKEYLRNAQLFISSLHGSFKTSFRPK
jgi:hypothetical protein